MKEKQKTFQTQRTTGAMRITRRITPLIMIIMVFMAGCKDDNDDPLPIQPLGSWTRTFTGAETYHAQLNLKDGQWEWIILDTLSNHTNSVGNYEIINDQIRWYDNPDCPDDGLYNWSVTGNKLVLEAVDDACTARVGGMAGTWDTLDVTGMQQLSGYWQKPMEVEGVWYDVQLTMSPDGVLVWEMIDPIPGHTNSTVSFTVNDNIIVIYNDSECGGNGYFTFGVNCCSLSITTLKDYCPPRAPSFSGVWSKPD